MRPYSPKNLNLSPGNGCAAAFLFVLAAGFIGVPLQDGVPLGLFHDAYQTTSFLLFELVGVCCLAAAIGFLGLWKAFDRPRVEISSKAQTGEAFPFAYRQRVRRALSFRGIDVFFVYREKVERGSSDGKSCYLYDRLITRQSFPAGRLRKGEEITLDCDFRVPYGEMGVRNPYMHGKGVNLECLWVVRVRVQYGKSSEIWEDHQVEVEQRGGVSGDAPDNAQQTGLFDALLLPSPVEMTTSILNALKEVAPYLNQSGVPYAQDSVANLIREQVSEQEAEAIADPLRAAGATVSIIPTEAAWRLPEGEAAKLPERTGP